MTQDRAVVNTSTGEVVAEAGPRTVFGTDEPAAIAARVGEMAEALAAFVDNRGMTQVISGRKYVVAEGWSYMGAMLGVHARTVRSVPMRDAEGIIQGYEAEVQLITRDGAVVGGAWAECSRTERDWGWHPTGRNGQALQARPDAALRSMAQTRATNKAYRMTFGFIMKAAGFDLDDDEAGGHQDQGDQGARQGQQGQGRQAGGRNQREPRPPQARPGPTDTVPVKRLEPEWVEDLYRRMQAQAVTPQHLKRFLGITANVIEWDEIQRWLDAEQGRTVADLVQATAVAMTAPMGDEQPAPEAGMDAGAGDEEGEDDTAGID